MEKEKTMKMKYEKLQLNENEIGTYLFCRQSLDYEVLLPFTCHDNRIVSEWK